MVCKRFILLIVLKKKIRSLPFHEYGKIFQSSKSQILPIPKKYISLDLTFFDKSDIYKPNINAYKLLGKVTEIKRKTSLPKKSQDFNHFQSMFEEPS